MFIMSFYSSDTKTSGSFSDSQDKEIFEGMMMFFSKSNLNIVLNLFCDSSNNNLPKVARGFIVKIC